MHRIKTWCLLAVAALLVALVACGGPSPSPAPAPAPAPTSAPAQATQLYPATGAKNGVVGSGSSPGMTFKCADIYRPVDVSVTPPSNVEYDGQVISVKSDATVAAAPNKVSGQTNVTIAFSGPGSLLPASVIVHSSPYTQDAKPATFDDQVVNLNNDLTAAGMLKLVTSDFSNGGYISGLTFCAGGGA